MIDALDEIKKLYYRTSKSTISRDFDAAVDLLKSMTTEDERERATVYMQGLAEMKAQWIPPRAASGRRASVRATPASGAPRSAAGPERSDRSKRGERRPR
jgi:hypothetical protein